ncbi:hypothetical protein [Flavobacterium sp. HJ-32-4]|uniref:hypothetical protein n=1 Tax=Flavobacterium sp. HJ-32-4 TaxID=1160795 RepID=UPI001F12968D|nr:hypothetical protein [Flavobacterium sp. HJ-32-4]UMY65299.1 hypothetical protein MKO97_12415 [Flavobacterium sp. HJ-32-4]
MNLQIDLVATKVPDLDKFCEMVIFFLKTINSFKAGLKQSTFFARIFKNYQKTTYSISGMRYLENDFGPAPHHFHSIFEMLNDMDCIHISYDSKKWLFRGEV